MTIAVLCSNGGTMAYGTQTKTALSDRCVQLLGAFAQLISNLGGISHTRPLSSDQAQQRLAGGGGEGKADLIDRNAHSKCACEELKTASSCGWGRGHLHLIDVMPEVSVRPGIESQIRRIT